MLYLLLIIIAWPWTEPTRKSFRSPSVCSARRWTPGVEAHAWFVCGLYVLSFRQPTFQAFTNIQRLSSSHFNRCSWLQVNFVKCSLLNCLLSSLNILLIIVNILLFQEFRNLNSEPTLRMMKRTPERSINEETHRPGTQLPTYIYIYMYLCVCVCVCVCVYLSLYIHIHTCTCIHVYIYIYIYMHMYYI